MKKNRYLIILSTFALPACILTGDKNIMIQSHHDAIALLPKTTEDIKRRAQQAMDEAKKAVQKIIDIPADQRTFDNTARALDMANTHFNALSTPISALEYVHPDKNIRELAHDTSIKLSKFAIDAFAYNIPLYNAFKEYYEGNATSESLSKVQRYFLDEEMKDYKRAGLDLPEATRAQVAQLSKELSEVSQEFSANIAKDIRKLIVSKDALAGMTDEFIEGLPKTEQGYELNTSYPIYFGIMKNCRVETTRKKMWQLFQNRAYPTNKDLLEKIIALRDERAKLLGFKSYAHLDLDSQMAKSPEFVESFLNELINKADIKETQEFKQLKADLPEGVELVEGKFKPWDKSFVQERYREKHFNVDDETIAQYFPMQHTIDQLLAIYQQFFNITLKQIPVSGLWHEDVKLIEACKQNGEILGYLFLDLFPRDNKYTHACEIDIKKGQIINGIIDPTVAIVIANFPKPTTSRPALLKHNDVVTFFHEFGHAIHDILGATELSSQAGTSVKRDFVELPSQMLEEWMYQPEILAMVSKHYQTGESLPQDLVNKIIALKKFDSGSFVQRQGMLARLSLAYFKEGDKKDLDATLKKIYESTINHGIFDHDNHFYASFGHLTGYGAKYYGYLWSKVFALDLFEHIKKFGLLNPEIGQVYVAKVIGKGGSDDPNNLLRDFLGREPNQDAFLKDLGL
jgi:thimet oligopeptidase